MTRIKAGVSTVKKGVLFRFLAIVLSIFIALSITALAEIDGVTRQEYFRRVNEFVSNSEWIIKNLKFTNSEVSRRTKTTCKTSGIDFTSYTFEDCDVIEFAIVKFPFSSDAQTLSDAIATLSPLFDGTLAERFENTKQSLVDAIIGLFGSAYVEGDTVNQYTLNIWRDANSTTVHAMWLNNYTTLSYDQLSDFCGYLVITKEAWEKQTGKPAGNSAETKSKTETLFAGEYVVGQHIPAGEYRVMPKGFGSIAVYSEGRLRVNEVLDADNDEILGRLVLKNDDVINISGTSMTFIPY